MTVNQSRSMNVELDLGATDGKYKHFNPNRGPIVDDLTTVERKQLSERYYDEEEPQVMYRGDGQIARRSR